MIEDRCKTVEFLKLKTRQWLSGARFDFKLSISSDEVSISLSSQAKSVVLLAEQFLGDYYDIDNIGTKSNWDIFVIESSVVAYIPIFYEMGRPTFTDFDQEATILHDDRCRYLLFKGNKTLLSADLIERRLLFISGDFRDCWRHVRRAIRRIFVHEVEKKGGMQIHAASVSYKNNAVVILGASGAGKSSCMTGLLLKSGAPYEILGNDRVQVWPENGKLYVRAWPTAFKLGIGTLLNYPEMHELIPPDLLERTANMSNEEIWNYRPKITITQPNLTRAFRANISRKSTLRVLLVPNIESEKISLRELSTTDVRGHVSNSILVEERDSSSDNPENRDWLGLRNADYSFKWHKHRLLRSVDFASISGYRLLGLPDWSWVHKSLRHHL